MTPRHQSFRLTAAERAAIDLEVTRRVGSGISTLSGLVCWAEFPASIDWDVNIAADRLVVRGRRQRRAIDQSLQRLRRAGELRFVGGLWERVPIEPLKAKAAARPKAARPSSRARARST